MRGSDLPVWRMAGYAGNSFALKVAVRPRGSLTVPLERSHPKRRRYTLGSQHRDTTRDSDAGTA